jgi:hypothetical protein
MSALPSNLALVAEDLARATHLDARKSRTRRRLATFTIAVALLALTAGAAVGSGWIFDEETPIVRVVPSLGIAAPGVVVPGRGESLAQVMTRIEAQHRLSQPAANGSAPLGQAGSGIPRTLLSGLGAHRRTLTSVVTSTGGACLTLSEVETECIAGFAPEQSAAWFTRTPVGGPLVVWGVVRSDVTAVDVVSTTGATVPAELGNGAFYAELADGPADHLVLHHGDGTAETASTLPCPPATPDCDS